MEMVAAALALFKVDLLALAVIRLIGVCAPMDCLRLVTLLEVEMSI